MLIDHLWYAQGLSWGRPDGAVAPGRQNTKRVCFSSKVTSEGIEKLIIGGAFKHIRARTSPRAPNTYSL